MVNSLMWRQYGPFSWVCQVYKSGFLVTISTIGCRVLEKAPSVERHRENSAGRDRHAPERLDRLRQLAGASTARHAGGLASHARRHRLQDEQPLSAAGLARPKLRIREVARRGALLHGSRTTSPGVGDAMAG